MTRRGVAAVRVGAAALALAGSTGIALAARYCDEPAPADAAQTARALQLAAAVRTALDASGARVALVARAGLDLGRFGLRYSHAGLALQASPGGAWAVRQLYYACDEQRPRVFDQGLAAFVLGMRSPDAGHLAVLALHGDDAHSLEQAAREAPTALGLLAADYSANAYAFATRYQNCNQWLAELLAAAWGGTGPNRAAAQAWLRAEDYAPTVFEVGWPLMALVPLLPHVQRDDHPAEDLAAARFRVSMPGSLWALATRRVPTALALEVCHTPQQAVLRRNGPPLADACTAEPGDTVIPLD